MSRHIEFTDHAFEEYDWWLEQSPRLLVRLNRLLKEACKTPFQGLGKPEALKGDLKGCWSRRIDQEHRLVYEVREDRIIVLQCRRHY